MTEKIKDWGLDWDFVRVVTAMTTFFEVFYSNTCYSRYTALYKSTRHMLQDASHYAYMLRAFLGEKATAHARLAVRYMMAGVMLHFYDLKDKSGEFELRELGRLGLVNHTEMQALLSHEKPNRPVMMLQWSLMVCLEGCSKADEKNVGVHFCNLLIKVRTQQQDVADTLKLQVPFQYFHLLSIMICMNLCMWAYSMALTDSWFAPVVYVFCSLIFIGMMDLASQLSDPFGDDVVDFNVDSWVSDTFKLVVELTENQYPGGPSGLQLCLQSEVPLPRGVQEVSVLKKSASQEEQGTADSSVARAAGPGKGQVPLQLPAVSPYSGYEDMRLEESQLLNSPYMNSDNRQCFRQCAR